MATQPTSTIPRLAAIPIAAAIFERWRSGQASITKATPSAHSPPMPKAAKNRDAAVKLIEFLVSEEAQAWYAETNNEFPVRADVPASELLQSWGTFKADNLALEELGIHNAEAVRLMDRAGWQ